MNFVDSSWLRQVALALIDEFGGPEAVSGFLAFIVLAAFALLALALARKSHRIGLSIAGALIVWLVQWNSQPLTNASPFGQLCLAVLLCLVGSIDVERKPWTFWLSCAALFAVWANVDESFVLGLAVLAAYTIGRAVEEFMRTRSFTAVLRNASFRRWLAAFEVAIAASLLNPYGDRLLLKVLVLPASQNLFDLIAWQPLDLTSRAGLFVAASWLAIVALFRHSRPPIKPADVLLLVGFSAAAAMQMRFVAAYFPVAVFVLIPHAVDVLGQLRRTRPAVRIRAAIRPLQVRSFRYTLLAGLALWLGFALSPTSRFVLGGKELSPERLYGNHTPIALTQCLAEHIPAGQIANPTGWGDWLVNRGPNGLDVFMTTRSIEHVPHQVWVDQLALSRGDAGFENTLSRYRVNTVVTDKQTQPKLIIALRKSANWKVTYEDGLGIVAVRVGPND